MCYELVNSLVTIVLVWTQGPNMISVSMLKHGIVEEGTPHLVGREDGAPDGRQLGSGCGPRAPRGPTALGARPSLPPARRCGHNRAQHRPGLLARRHDPLHELACTHVVKFLL